MRKGYENQFMILFSFKNKKKKIKAKEIWKLILDLIFPRKKRKKPRKNMKIN